MPEALKLGIAHAWNFLGPSEALVAPQIRLALALLSISPNMSPMVSSSDSRLALDTLISALALYEKTKYAFEALELSKRTWHWIF